MLYILTLLNKAAQTYTRSLQKDLTKAGFDSVLVIASISWAGVLILLGLLVLGKFQLPSDPYFYLYWFILVFIVTIQFYFFSAGLVRTHFYSANSISHVSFVITIIYAVLILNESITSMQIFAIVIAIIGSLLLFEWHKEARQALKKNTGLLLIIFSLLISPFSIILLKTSVYHTDSYTQFLTGRLVLDAIYYSLFFAVLYAFWYRRNPAGSIVSFIKSKQGLGFMFGSALLNLIDSWLIYKLPVVTFTILGTISIVAGYAISRLKYKEPIYFKEIFGGVLIILSIIVFTIK